MIDNGHSCSIAVYLIGGCSFGGDACAAARSRATCSTVLRSAIVVVDNFPEVPAKLIQRLALRVRARPAGNVPDEQVRFLVAFDDGCEGALRTSRLHEGRSTPFANT